MTSAEVAAVSNSDRGSFSGHPPYHLLTYLALTTGVAEMVDALMSEVSSLWLCRFESCHQYILKPCSLLHKRLFLQSGQIYRIKKMPKKQSGNNTSSLAGRILSGSKKATQGDAKKLAASVLSQDEKKGKRK